MAGNHRWHKMEAATTISKGRLAARKEGSCADDVHQGRTGRSLQKQNLRGGREHLKMPASQWWRSSAPACSGLLGLWLCLSLLVFPARHPHFRLSSHSFCRWRAALRLFGPRNLNLLLKPVWQWFSFFLINRTQNAIKISSCHPTSCIWKYRPVDLRATRSGEKRSIIFSLLLHKWKSLKYLRVFSFLKKRKGPKGHGWADEEHVTPL